MEGGKKREAFQQAERFPINTQFAVTTGDFASSSLSLVAWEPSPLPLLSPNFHPIIIVAGGERSSLGLCIHYCKIWIREGKSVSVRNAITISMRFMRSVADDRMNGAFGKEVKL